jgi:predicted DNA-binding protein
MTNPLKRTPPQLFAAPVTEKPAAPVAVAPSAEAAPAAGEAAGESAIDLRDEVPAPTNRNRAKSRRPAQRPPVAGVQSATVIRLTEEQWAWVDSQSAATKLPKWQVVLAAVADHVTELDAYFAVLIPEGGSVFYYRASPQDVEGKKVERSIRLPQMDRGVLDGLVERSGARSMSMYLRVAVHMAMRPEAGQGQKSGSRRRA